jgi:(p)ppGpp synthase/HD superfamily hydrolase
LWRSSTAGGHKPGRDWLNFVVTSHAPQRSPLIRREERVRAIELGRKVLDKGARRYDLNIKTLHR